MRTKEEMYNDIKNWEKNAGEDFLDYFGSDMNEFNLMFWALGKGYITEEQLQLFEKETCPSTSYLFGDEDYSIVNDEYNERENFDKALEKAYRILADFLTATNTYQTRVDRFLKNIVHLTFDEALRDFYRRDKVFFELNGERTYLQSDTKLTADIISQAKWFRDDN
ncbi:hypothetical protein AB3N02_21650 [Priestia aryabhattai]|uniref:hypothetical protein n=1 Tax=Priestia aryabhattai TaxID=412384 RepID=UPI0039A1146F